MDTSIHPFRITVFGESEVIKGKGKRAKIERRGFGFDLWNPCEQTAELAGRPGFFSRRAIAKAFEDIKEVSE